MVIYHPFRRAIVSRQHKTNGCAYCTAMMSPCQWFLFQNIRSNYNCFASIWVLRESPLHLFVDQRRGVISIHRLLRRPRCRLSRC